MLVNGSAEHIKKSKLYCSIEFCPLSKCDEWFPSPRVLNTHYRLDVLPKEFHGRKTVLGNSNVSIVLKYSSHHEHKKLFHYDIEAS